MSFQSDDGNSGTLAYAPTTPEKTFAYSDGSLTLVRNDMNMQVAVFSDVRWAESGRCSICYGVLLNVGAL